MTIERSLLRELDDLVARRAFPNRSRAVQQALREKLERMRKTRLAREAAKLDPTEERALAEESLGRGSAGWPEY